MSKPTTKNDMLISILESIVIITFGIVIAVCGPSAAINTWFGVGFVVGGALCLTLTLVNLFRTKLLPFGMAFMSAAFLTLGIALLTGNLSFAVIVPIYVLLVLALGAALVFHGLYTLFAVKNPLVAVAELVFGGLAITFAILYWNIPEFQTAFWIITGILVVLIGVLNFIACFTKKK